MTTLGGPSNRALREWLSGGDRRSVAQSKRVHSIIEAFPDRVKDLVLLQITLTPAELDCIEASRLPTAVAGTGYDEHQMRVRDREREGTGT